MVPSQLDDGHEGGDRDQAESDHAVEAAGLRVRPGVEWPNDLPPVVRVGAALLDGAGVADVCARPITHEPTLVVEVMWPQVLALGAAPVVAVGVVDEAGGAEAERASVRVRRKPFEEECGEQQEARIAGRENGFRAHVILAAAASSARIPAVPSGSWISVKRMSSGSSSATRLTVWRMPR